MLGLAGGALAGAMKYAGEREQFGSSLKKFLSSVSTCSNGSDVRDRKTVGLQCS